MDIGCAVALRSSAPFVFSRSSRAAADLRNPTAGPAGLTVHVPLTRKRDLQLRKKVRRYTTWQTHKVVR